MTLLSGDDINHLEDILNYLRDLQSVTAQQPAIMIYGSEGLKTNIDWLYTLIKQLSRDLHNAIRAKAEAAAKYDSLLRDFELARAEIESLKHLQKYEGIQKIESDNLGHKAEVALLKNAIARLKAELEGCK